MIKIPTQVKTVLDKLEQAGHEAFMIGGCIRDSIMGIEPKDYDVTTSARPDETKAVFQGYPVIETGMKHGTVTVVVDEMPVEITTYRVDGNYVDNRHPQKVCFTTSLREDAARRDFTINAIAYNPGVGIVDYFGGLEDIEAGVIRCVGEPAKRFEEDALRIMRALRFSSVNGFKIEEKTAEAAVDCRGLLRKISVERIREELVKLLCGKDAQRILLEYTEILGVVLPELLEMRGFQQQNPHHIYDVLKHTAVAVSNVPPEAGLRLGALLHDIGKPRCFTVDEEGTGHFYGHGKISGEMARDVLNRLKFDNATKDRVITLVVAHDAVIEDTEKSVKRALNRLSPAMFFELIALKRADNMAQNPKYSYRQSYYDRLESIAKEIIEKEECFSLKDLAVRGGDLLEMGIPRGKKIGQVLEKLLEAVIAGEVANEKEELLKKVIAFSKS